MSEHSFAIHSQINMDDMAYIQQMLKDYVEGKLEKDYNKVKRTIEIIDKLSALIDNFNQETKE